MRRVWQAMCDRRVMLGAVLAVHGAALGVILASPELIPRWLVAVVAGTFGAQVINFANLIRLGTVTELLAEVKELNARVREEHEKALKLVEDVEGADAIAVLRDGKVVNSHVIRVPKGALH